MCSLSKISPSLLTSNYALCYNDYVQLFCYIPVQLFLFSPPSINSGKALSATKSGTNFGFFHRNIQNIHLISFNAMLTKVL
jgi:hypothetical protein